MALLSNEVIQFLSDYLDSFQDARNEKWSCDDKDFNISSSPYCTITLKDKLVIGEYTLLTDNDDGDVYLVRNSNKIEDKTDEIKKLKDQLAQISKRLAYLEKH